MIPTGLENLTPAIAISAATFVSEDATCIATGLLLRAGQLGWFTGLCACTLGIFFGDLGLWLLGRACGRRVLAWRWLRARVPENRIEEYGHWFDRRGWKLVLAARFLPGTRLPVYIAAGIFGRRSGRFALWALLAALLWTPALVLSVALLGNVAVPRFQGFFGAGWLAFVAAFIAFWMLARLLPLCATAIGRARLWAGISRLWRWEFWPSWVFYIPLIPYIGYLALRYRGLMTPTAANPGIVPHGGVVGESKFAILSRLPQEWIVPSTRIEPGTASARAAHLDRIMRERGWNFPLILKPDAGQRGIGVCLVRDACAAANYLREHPRAVIAQSYHSGPFEAGIFYCRMPDEPRGRIFSITDKQFPVLIGDGASTVRALLWNQPRFRMQAGMFLARMNGQAETILAAGERLTLTIAGNHCQGTLFRDGAHLLTPELEQTIDGIARRFDGFYFGRFDVRYGNLNEFKAGRGFAIIELNGITSESTNLYDPAWSLRRAYRLLFEQWAILYRIGDQNRRYGHVPSSLWSVLRDARAYYKDRAAEPLTGGMIAYST